MTFGAVVTVETGLRDDDAYRLLGLGAHGWHKAAA